MFEASCPITPRINFQVYCQLRLGPSTPAPEIVIVGDTSILEENRLVCLFREMKVVCNSVCFNTIPCGCWFFEGLFLNCSFLCISLLKGRSEVFLDVKYLSGALAVLACVDDM